MSASENNNFNDANTRQNSKSEKLNCILFHAHKHSNDKKIMMTMMLIFLQFCVNCYVMA